MEAHKEADFLALVHFALYKTWFDQEIAHWQYDAVRIYIWQTESLALTVTFHVLCPIAPILDVNLEDIIFIRMNRISNIVR